MKLVVGLGNPGRKYALTRHNVGFAVLDLLVRQSPAPPASPRQQFRGETVEMEISGHRSLLLWPHTYMNRSGASVLEARDFYKLPLEDILVICDDFNLPLARLRFRPGGSAGGQKGLQDIIRCLGTEQIARLRIGIGPLPPHFDPADFVLGKLTRQEQDQLEPALERAARGVQVWVRDGVQACMNAFNADPHRQKRPAQAKEPPTAGQEANPPEAESTPPA